MIMPTDRDETIRRLLFWGSIIIVAVCLYELVTAVIVERTTGILQVNALNSKATLSVSQPDHGAAILGTGQATVRLKPGEYQVAATTGGAMASTTVKVEKHRTAKATLNLNQSIQLPSTANINFVGQDALTDYGVTAAQVGVLKQKFFQFSKNAKTIIISGISPVPHDPNSASVMDTINFKVSVDSKNYTGRLDYSALNDTVRLYLYNPTGNTLVFDSGSSSNAE